MLTDKLALVGGGGVELNRLSILEGVYVYSTPSVLFSMHKLHIIHVCMVYCLGTMFGSEQTKWSKNVVLQMPVQLALTSIYIAYTCKHFKHYAFQN